MRDAVIRRHAERCPLCHRLASKEEVRSLLVQVTAASPGRPLWPEIRLRMAGIQGTVILEAMIDSQGNVVRVKVLESIPALDQAAVDALKQWKYEPVIIEGRPKSIVFTVIIRFRLE